MARLFVESGFPMNATSRTLVFLSVAAAAVLTAVAVDYATRPATVEGFSEVGQEFFADFDDPLQATELSVIKYDSASSAIQAFTVKQDDKGHWVIPSHHNYPAEAAERLAKTATSMIGIRKVAIQSRSELDWARYGVADPAAEIAVSLEDADEEKPDPRGTRITLRDASGNALTDLIVGSKVKGRENHYYIRQPEKNAVFVAQFDADLSARFSDWIEPDLLKLNQNDIIAVTVDQYSVDEEQGAIVRGDRFDFSKDKTTSKWSMKGLDESVASLKETAVTEITRNLDQLKIVGVRPKPAGLNSDLTIDSNVPLAELKQEALFKEMQLQGFYIGSAGNGKLKLASNEGELIAGTNNGVQYTLYFGEIARGTAKDIETGLNDKKPAEGEAKTEGGEAKAEGEKAAEGAEADAVKPEDKPEDSESGPRRYLLVKVDYDESLLGPKPTEPVAPEKPAILNEGAAPAPEEDKKPEAPADAPKADAPPADSPKDAPATEEKPAADAAPKEEVQKEETPAPEKAAEAAPEKPADPGSCDEPAAAEPAAVVDPAAVVEPAAPAQEAAAEAKPAEPAAAAPVQEGQPAPADGEKPAAETPATAAPAEGDAPAAAPAQPPVDPKAEAQKQYDQAMGEYEAAKAGFEGALKAWESKAKEGKKKADELSSRFGAWYYVISAESFEKFKLTRDAVVGPKEEAKPADGAGAPGLGGPPSFDLPGLGN